MTGIPVWIPGPKPVYIHPHLPRSRVPGDIEVQGFGGKKSDCVRLLESVILTSQFWCLMRMFLLVVVLLSSLPLHAEPADLILRNARVCTVEPSQPWASAVVISGNQISAVLDADADLEKYRGAYAFRSLIENGATLVFGSGWGGSPAADYEVHPKYLPHAAVNRTTIKGVPEGGWFPREKISMREALRAYTINAARAALDGERRGSLKAGKLADIVVWDQNLMEMDPGKILSANVDMTIVDGKMVYERE